jgi:hypothetical protein
MPPAIARDPETDARRTGALWHPRRTPNPVRLPINRGRYGFAEFLADYPTVSRQLAIAALEECGLRLLDEASSSLISTDKPSTAHGYTPKGPPFDMRRQHEAGTVIFNGNPL